MDIRGTGKISDTNLSVRMKTKYFQIDFTAPNS
jgi:hypothetical protein